MANKSADLDFDSPMPSRTRRTASKPKASRKRKLLLLDLASWSNSPPTICAMAQPQSRSMLHRPSNSISTFEGSCSYAHLRAESLSS